MIGLGFGSQLGTLTAFLDSAIIGFLQRLRKCSSQAVCQAEGVTNDQGFASQDLGT